MATSRQPISARITARGNAPAAKDAPRTIEKATAAAGAMCVTDWKNTSRSPIASRARPGDGMGGGAGVVRSTMLLLGLGYRMAVVILPPEAPQRKVAIAGWPRNRSPLRPK